MGDYWANAVRHPEDVGIGHIRRTVNLALLSNPAYAADGVPIGTLEAGAIPLRTDVTIITPFNAGTTNNLDVGTKGNVGVLAPNTATLAGAAGFKAGLTGPQSGQPLTADTTVYAKFSQSGTPATQGVAIVIQTFVNRREVEGIPFPNNP